jgi:hypothetical protein
MSMYGECISRGNEITTREDFKDVCQPVVDFLNKYGTPHSTVIIQQDHAEFVNGEMCVPFELRD